MDFTKIFLVHFDCLFFNYYILILFNSLLEYVEGQTRTMKWVVDYSLEHLRLVRRHDVTILILHKENSFPALVEGQLFQ